MELTERFDREYCPACLSDLGNDRRFAGCDRDCDTLDDLIAILRELRHKRGNLPVALDSGGTGKAADGLWVTDAFDRGNGGRLSFAGENSGDTVTLMPRRAYL